MHAQTIARLDRIYVGGYAHTDFAKGDQDAPSLTVSKGLIRLRGRRLPGMRRWRLVLVVRMGYPAAHLSCGTATIVPQVAAVFVGVA